MIGLSLTYLNFLRILYYSYLANHQATTLLYFVFYYLVIFAFKFMDCFMMRKHYLSHHFFILNHFQLLIIVRVLLFFQFNLYFPIAWFLILANLLTEFLFIFIAFLILVLCYSFIHYLEFIINLLIFLFKLLRYQ